METEVFQDGFPHSLDELSNLAEALGAGKFFIHFVI